MHDHFIPFSRADVVEMCVADGKLVDGASAEFREFCHILQSLVHFEHHEKLEQIKRCYRPFNPDRDTQDFKPPTAEELPALRKQLIDLLQDLLGDANYRRLDESEIKEAFEEEALFHIQLEINFDDFEELEIYARGEGVRKETVPTWWGLKSKTIDLKYLERVAIYVKFKEKEHFGEKRLSSVPFEPGSTILKLFQNIPKADLEMLFPNGEVRMRPLDKLLIGVPALIGAVVILVKNLLGAAIVLFVLVKYWLGISKTGMPETKQFVVLGVGVAVLVAYLFKQYTKFKNRKIQFMKELTDNLYFRNLDNNAGVFHHLTDAAEEEECKEMILAYYFLISRQEKFTEQTLDEAVEGWFKETHGVTMDFEVDDAMAKLEALKLAHRDGETLHCLSIHEAKVHIDEIWDNYFDFQQAPQTSTPAD